MVAVVPLTTLCKTIEHSLQYCHHLFNTTSIFSKFIYLKVHGMTQLISNKTSITDTQRNIGNSWVRDLTR